MPVQKLRDYLDEHNVRYVVISHSSAFTAQEIAASAHVPGRELAKTVMAKVDGRLVMVVLPASRRVEFDRLKEAIGAESAELASEQDFAQVFGDCEVGAMPPFGNLYGLEVYVDRHLAEDEEIAFNAGSHTELLRMRYDDFERLVQPMVIELSRKAAA